MVDIQNADIIDRLQSETKAQPVMALPKQIVNTIQPVILVNPLPKVIELKLVVSTNVVTFSVPAGKIWRILFGKVRYVTSADVGSRVLVFNVTISTGTGVSDGVYLIGADNAQVASLTEHYNFSQFGNIAEIETGSHTIPIPSNLILKAGARVQISDSNDVTSNDSMTAVFMIEERDAIVTN